jgi:tetratricopeptide (TPR) repeat protein
MYAHKMETDKAGSAAMPDCTTPTALRYSAFISYSHLDAVAARRLHRRLENYRLPRRLAQGRPGASRRLKPVFRDRDELAAAPDLSAAVRGAIADADYLIVICSQHAQDSAWVAREVALFREVHGDGAILGALVDGCSDANLRHLLGENHAGNRHMEPLAADFRRQGDGPRLAILKLVAVLADVRLDQLVQRDAQRRVRQATIAGTSACVGVAAMVALAIATINARNAIDHERARGGAMIDYQLTDLRNQLKGVGRLDVLEKINQGAAEYYKSIDNSQLSPQALALRAKLLQASGEDDEKYGKYDTAKQRFVDAAAITASLLDAAPDDTNIIFAHSQSVYWLGFIDWRLGLYSEAKENFQAYKTLADRLVRLGPNNPDWLMERGYAEGNLGMLLLRHRVDVERAEPHLQDSLNDFISAEKHRRGDANILLEIADGYGWLGDSRRLRGDCDGARAKRQQASKILSDLQSRDARNVEVLIEVIANKLALARIDMCQGSLAEAVSLLQETHTLADTVAMGDPENADLRRKARILTLFEALAWLEMPIARQPSGQAISETLGDCRAERRMPHNDELAKFCFVLQARRAAQSGDSAGAVRLLDTAKSIYSGQGDWLSARWGLNFAEEMRNALPQISK